MTLVVLLVIIATLGLYMAWTIGANDAANSMGNAVGSKAISIKKALFLAGICEFAGSVLVGSHVTDTIRKGIVDPNSLAGAPEMLAIGMACALLAAAVWLHLATWCGMPVSTTHSIVGAVAGFGIVAAGWRAVQWGVLGEIVASWFISPIAGIVLGFACFKLIAHLVLWTDKPAASAIRYWPWVVFVVVLVITTSTLCNKGLQMRIPSVKTWLAGSWAFLWSVIISVAVAAVARMFVGRHMRDHHEASIAEQLDRVERIFAPLVVITSCSVAFAHGANDVANAVGPLAAIVDMVRTGTVHMRVMVPMWILILGGAGIVLGLTMFGQRVIVTVGERITQLTPSRGVAANIATATIVLVCSRMKLPISTTHILVGAIFGVGFARGLSAVNRNVAKSIFGSWMFSVPAAAILAMVFFLLCRLLNLGEVVKSVMTAAGC